jgi:hypothetical protein
MPERLNMKTTITKKQLAELSSDNPRTKYRRAKSLVTVARKEPRRLSPHLGFFVKLLDSENNVLKWAAIDVIGSLASVVMKNRVDQFIEVLVDFLRGGKLIAANHAIAALSHVALAKPQYQDRITRELLNVQHYTYETEECHNIVLGKVVEALGSYSGRLNPNNEMLAFVRHQTENSRSATRKKAEKLLKRFAHST